MRAMSDVGAQPASGVGAVPRPSMARSLAIKAIVMLVMLGVMLLMAEMGTRLFYARLATYNTEMWRYAAELKQPLPYAHLPFHHAPNRQGFYYGATIKTNSHGFRDAEYSVAKPAGTTRIMMLGDSLTLGWGVPVEETFAKRLERRLQDRPAPYQVINLGIGNYNSEMELELFKRKGLAFSPDVVVLMYFINDMEPTPVVGTFLKEEIAPHSYFSALLFDRYLRLRALTDRHYDWRQYYASLYAPGAPGRAANIAAIEELSQICRERGIKLLIVNIPELRVLKDYPFPFATDLVRSLASRHQVPFLDLLPALAVHEPSTLWVTPEDPHANGLANGVIAGALYDELVAKGMLP